ncbi:MAG: hypothetical protein V7752_13280 [Halopseudomonas sp.]
MREDFYLSFPGFGGCDSKCHIRILADSGKPIVIICSQLKTSPGTSVMNAYEIIRSHVYEYLAKKHSEKLKHDTALELDGLADTIENTKKVGVAIIAYLVRFAARALTKKVPLLEQISREEPDMYWIEHWPEGTGLRREVDFLLVSENEVGSPDWTRVSANSLAKELGYANSDFDIPDAAVA